MSDSSDLRERILQKIRENPQTFAAAIEAEFIDKPYQKAQKERQAFLQKRRNHPSSVIGESPKMGAGAQKIVLLKFADFQCPHCAQIHKIVQQFMDKHQDQVTFTHKYSPFSEIYIETPTAKAAWAAQQQGNFWEYYDALFTQQERLCESLYSRHFPTGEDELKTWAEIQQCSVSTGSFFKRETLYLEITKNLNLDLDRFNKDRQSLAAETAINKDIELAQSIGLPLQSFLTLNGEIFAGQLTLADLEQALERVVQISFTESQTQPYPERQ